MKRNPQWTPVEIERLSQAVADGKTSAEIGRILGRTTDDCTVQAGKTRHKAAGMDGYAYTVGATHKVSHGGLETQRYWQYLWCDTGKGFWASL